MPMQKLSSAGIIETPSGVRKIPESRRPDGSIRSERLIRPDFIPEEDQLLYVNPLVQRARQFEASNFGRRPVNQQQSQNLNEPQTKAAKKNAKRKEAKKKKKAGEIDS